MCKHIRLCAGGLPMVMSQAYYICMYYYVVSIQGVCLSVSNILCWSEALIKQKK